VNITFFPCDNSIHAQMRKEDSVLWQGTFSPSQDLHFGACGDAWVDDVQITYDDTTQTLNFCYQMFSLMSYSANMCLALRSLVLSPQGVRFCPQIEYRSGGAPLPIITFIDCVEYGYADPCGVRHSCGECILGEGCGWCETRGECRSLNTSAIDTCGGCGGSILQSCDSDLLDQEQENKDLLSVFASIDVNGDYLISEGEFSASVGSFARSIVSTIYGSLDVNGDMSLSFDEFKHFQLKKKK